MWGRREIIHQRLGHAGVAQHQQLDHAGRGTTRLCHASPAWMGLLRQASRNRHQAIDLVIALFVSRYWAAPWLLLP